MSDSPPFVPEWSAAVDPRLADRLLRRATQPGLTRRAMADGVIGRVTRLRGQLPLLAELQRRHAPPLAALGTGGPIVYASLRIPDSVGTSARHSVPSVEAPPAATLVSPPVVQRVAVSTPTTPAAAPTALPPTELASSTSAGAATAAPDVPAPQVPPASAAHHGPAIPRTSERRGSRGRRGKGGAAKPAETASPPAVTPAPEVAVARSDADAAVPVVVAGEPRAAAEGVAVAGALPLAVPAVGDASTSSDAPSDAVQRASASSSDDVERGASTASGLVPTAVAPPVVESADAEAGDASALLPVVRPKARGPTSLPSLQLARTAPGGTTAAESASPAKPAPPFARPRSPLTLPPVGSAAPERGIAPSPVQPGGSAAGRPASRDGVQASVGAPAAPRRPTPVVSPGPARSMALPGMPIARSGASAAGAAGIPAPVLPSVQRQPEPAVVHRRTGPAPGWLDRMAAETLAPPPVRTAAPTVQRANAATPQRASSPDTPSSTARPGASSSDAPSSSAAPSDASSATSPSVDGGIGLPDASGAGPAGAPRTVVQRASARTDVAGSAGPMPLVVPAPADGNGAPSAATPPSIGISRAAGTAPPASDTTSPTPSASPRARVGGAVESAAGTVIRRASATPVSPARSVVGGARGGAPWADALARPLTLPPSDGGSTLRRRGDGGSTAAASSPSVDAGTPTGSGATGAARGGPSSAVPVVRPNAAGRAAAGDTIHRPLARPGLASAERPASPPSPRPVVAAGEPAHGAGTPSPLALPLAASPAADMQRAASAEAASIDVASGMATGATAVPVVRPAASPPRADAAATLQRAPLVLPAASPRTADAGPGGVPPLALPRGGVGAGPRAGATGAFASAGVPASVQRVGAADADLPVLPSRRIDDDEDPDGEREADVERVADGVLDRLAQRLAAERSLRGW